MLGIALRALEPLRGQHWILDGFPRTVNQAQLLDNALVKSGRGLNLVVNLGVSDATILSRIEGAARSVCCSACWRRLIRRLLSSPTDRYVHVPSGRVYNTTYNAPLVEGKDDVTGEALEKRPDDTPVRQQPLTCDGHDPAKLLTLTHYRNPQEVFQKRLDLYNRETFPLLA
jgi:nucleoside-triphosphate--adenylate kinase